MYLGKNVFERESEKRRASVEEKSRFWWEIIPISGFQVIKEEEGSQGKEFQEIQGMNLNPRKLYLMFGLEKP